MVDNGKRYGKYRNVRKIGRVCFGMVDKEISRQSLIMYTNTVDTSSRVKLPEGKEFVVSVMGLKKIKRN